MDEIIESLDRICEYGINIRAIERHVPEFVGSPCGLLGAAWALEHPAFKILKEDVKLVDHSFIGKIYRYNRKLRRDITIQYGRETAAMLWMEYYHLTPPRWMEHNPPIQGKYGMTAAMYHCLYVRTIPIPYWMEHNPLIRDENGRTCAMICTSTHNGNHVPAWARHDPGIVDNSGLNCLAIWDMANLACDDMCPRWMVPQERRRRDESVVMRSSADDRKGFEP